MGGGLFFHNVILVRLPHMPFYHRSTKEGKCGATFSTVHRRYDTDFPPKSELRKRKVNELKSQLTGQQSFFTQHTSKAKAARSIVPGVSRHC